MACQRYLREIDMYPHVPSVLLLNSLQELLSLRFAATGFGKYLHMLLNKISDFDPLEQEWKVVRSEKDPETIEL